jgi:hypothetical protein
MLALLQSAKEKSPLHYACVPVRGHERVSALLLEAGANVQCTDKLGRSPLYAACAFGYDLHTIQHLLRAGAVVNHRDAEGRTPLFYAATKGYPAAGEIGLCTSSRCRLETGLLANTETYPDTIDRPTIPRMLWQRTPAPFGGLRDWGPCHLTKENFRRRDRIRVTARWRKDTGEVHCPSGGQDTASAMLWTSRATF